MAIIPARLLLFPPLLFSPEDKFFVTVKRAANSLWTRSRCLVALHYISRTLPFNSFLRRRLITNSRNETRSETAILALVREFGSWTPATDAKRNLIRESTFRVASSNEVIRTKKESPQTSKAGGSAVFLLLMRILSDCDNSSQCSRNGGWVCGDPFEVLLCAWVNAKLACTATIWQ